MERIKRIKNPYQDRINALNAKDIDEGIKVDNFLYKKREPIPDDINNERFAMTDVLIPNTLKPEELSMKDLLDQIQSETILNNNIAPYVKKEIKSEVTQEMIKQFQYESSKPVEINGTFYKYKPPGVDINLTAVPPPFPTEAEYKGTIRKLYQQELKIGKDLERRRVVLKTEIERKAAQYDNSRISRDEFQAAVRLYESSMSDLSDAINENDTTVSNLSIDYDLYDEYKLEYETKVDLIEKENKKQLATYEDELKSRNTGMEVAKTDTETDEEYAQRLLDTAQETVDPAQVETQAKLFLYNSVKDLMNELTPAYKSEAILNTIIQAGGYEKLQPIKDQWPAVKKLLIDTFGNVGRVENTDSVAQVMYNSTMKPFVRPAGPSPTSSTTLSSTPTMSPPNVRPPIRYSRTEVPTSRTRQDTQIFVGAPAFPTPPSEIRKPPTPLSAPTRPSSEYMLKRNEIVRTSRPFPTDIVVRNQPAENSVITPLDIGYYLRTRYPTTRPYPTDIVVRQSDLKPALERVGKRIPREVGLKSESAYDEELARLYALLPEETSRTNRFEQSKFMPMSTFTYQDLRFMLSEMGETFKTGNSEASKKANYEKLAGLGKIPPRESFMPRDDFLQLNTFEMADYLDRNGIKGTRSGKATDKLGRGDAKAKLIKQYDAYMTKMAGRGLKSEHLRNIKDEFLIIDGEIQAGNNNPALIRDARKMLKQMVQQKLVTLYEAQKHMIHLRKINKI